jgi:hypothetical protein
MCRPTHHLARAAHQNSRPTIVAGISILAVVLNFVSWQFAAATGKVAQPTPRPWGNFGPVKLSRQTLNRGRQACSYLQTRHGMRHIAAAAVIGHLIQESKVKPTGIRGDRGTAFGVAQWRGIRFRALKSFARKSGRSWKDLHAQLDYIAHELRTNERLSGQKLRAADTLDAAVVAFMHYERPRGYTYANPRRGNAWRKRLANAAFIASYGHCTPVGREVSMVRLDGHH